MGHIVNKSFCDRYNRRMMVQYDRWLTHICDKREACINCLVGIAKVPAINTHNPFYFVRILLGINGTIEQLYRYTAPKTKLLKITLYRFVIGQNFV